MQYRDATERRSIRGDFAGGRAGNRRETRRTQPAHPQRQRDFRHQHERGAIACERGFDGLKVDFRFAAAGNAEEQAGGELTRVEPRANLGQSALLIGVQICWRAARSRLRED